MVVFAGGLTRTSGALRRNGRRHLARNGGLYLAYFFLACLGCSSPVNSEVNDGAAQGCSASSSAIAIANALAVVPRIGAILISTHGEFVAYSVERRHLVENSTQTEWYVQPIADGRARGTPERLPLGATAVRGRPGNLHQLSYLAPDRSAAGESSSRLRLFDTATGLITAPLQQHMTGAGDDAPAVQIGDDYQWSPTGDMIAFSAPIGRPSSRSHGGVPFSLWESETAPAYALFITTINDGATRQLTPANVRIVTFIENDISSFDWSPDGREIAVTVEEGVESHMANVDLSVVDLDGSMRNLVARPGMDGFPIWSRDGTHIAFVTNRGVPNYLGGWPSVIAANGADESTVSTPEDVPRTFSLRTWNRRNDGILYDAAFRMTSRITSFNRNSHRIEIAAIAAPAADEALHTFSSDGQWVAFTRSYVNSPPEIYLSRAAPTGFPSPSARRITDLGEGFCLGVEIREDLVSWRNPSDGLEIHGLLLSPARAWNGTHLSTPLPTVLALHGGPEMVRRGFAQRGWTEMRVALAAHGYAVLVPNTRGRQGFGDRLLTGIRDGGSNARLPYLDAISGIDFLVASGIADPAKLGVIGHSYGGFLTAYSITQTHRFRAAVVHEGMTDLLNYLYPEAAGSLRYLLARDLFGITRPMAPAERARILEASPALHVDRISTPTLLSYGSAAGVEQAGRRLFQSLRSANVPAALFVYDGEGHDFRRPQAMASDMTRTLEWLDYWIRGVPYPDRQRAAEFSQ